MDSTFDIITKKDCYKIIGSKSDKVSSLIEYRITRANENTVGFLGDYFQLRLLLLDGEGKREEIYFLKTEPLYNEAQRNFVQDCGVFKKEAFLYEKIIPEFIKIAKVNFIPSCPLIKEEVLVLEDLKCRNFDIIRRDYTLHECEALIKTLALFHSCSVIYEEKLRKSGEEFSFKQYMEKLPEGTFSFDEENPKFKWMTCASSCVIDFMKTLEVHDETLEIELSNFVLGGELKKSIEPSDRFRNVLTHNDLWSNNIFLGNNDQCILIDFQLVRYTPPAYDLIMALYLNTSAEFIQNHFKSCLALYYDTFSKLLEDNHLKPDDVFPIDEFYESVDVYRLPALIEATMFATNVYLPAEKSTYIRRDPERYEKFLFSSRVPFIMDTFRNDQIYRRKIKGMLEALAETIKRKTIS